MENWRKLSQNYHQIYLLSKSSANNDRINIIPEMMVLAAGDKKKVCQSVILANNIEFGSDSLKQLY